MTIYIVMEYLREAKLEDAGNGYELPGAVGCATAGEVLIYRHEETA
jgi:hypothetical protein